MITDEPIEPDLVAPRIERLALRTPTLPPATQTNSYLVGAGELLLVEPATPYEDELRRAVAWVEGRRGEGARPLALLATHHHPDHVGGAMALAARLSLPLWAHALTAERLRGEVTFDRALEDDEVLTLAGPVTTSVRVMHTPGHAPGHVCLLDEESRAMIAGDMVASVGTILVEPRDGDMALYLRSLQRMIDESPTVLLPAHGDPIRAPTDHLRHYIAHRMAREERVHGALVEAAASDRAPVTAAAIVPRAYSDAPREVWGLAALSTEAHLIHLVAQGRATRDGMGFRPAPDPA